MSHTLESVLSIYNITVPDETIAEITIPILGGDGTPQRQGDVAIFRRAPIGKAELSKAVRVPERGVAVVRGESGGNTHFLHPEGVCWWAPATARAGEVVLGVLHVEDDAVAYLIHTEEHGANGIAPGTYVLHGKREQAAEIRRVAD